MLNQALFWSAENEIYIDSVRRRLLVIFRKYFAPQSREVGAMGRCNLFPKKCFLFQMGCCLLYI